MFYALKIAIHNTEFLRKKSQGYCKNKLNLFLLDMQNTEFGNNKT